MKTTLSLILTLVFAMAALPGLSASDEALTLSQAREQLGEETSEKIASASSAVYGQIQTVFPGMTTRSIPPQVLADLTLTDTVCVFGQAIPANGRIRVRYIGNDFANVFASGKSYLFLSSSQEQVFTTFIELEKDKLPAVKLIGARMFPGLENAADENAFPMPKGVFYNVISLPPVKRVKWQNDYGDGLFSIELTNHTDSTLRVPVRLNEDGTPHWEASVVIIDQAGKKHRIFTPTVSTKRYLMLKPGETVSGTINTLKLNTMQWPSGGARVYMTFAVADAKKEAFFYYFSTLHDKMAEQSKKGE